MLLEKARARGLDLTGNDLILGREIEIQEATTVTVNG